MSGYDALLVLARRERDLIAAERWDELHALDEERAAVRSTLPSSPPAGVQSVLLATAEQQEQNVVALAAARENTQRALVSLDRSRHVARGYAPGAASGGSLIDSRAS